jgi:hypothetical protein
VARPETKLKVDLIRFKPKGIKLEINGKEDNDINCPAGGSSFPERKQKSCTSAKREKKRDKDQR